MPLGDRLARVDRVVVAEPLRGDPVGGRDVLHEDAAGARGLIPRRRELVTHLERLRQVVVREEHQAVAEAVHALVRDEGATPNVRVRAQLARDGAELIRVDVRVGALEDPVVVARPAARGALRERLPDPAVEAHERCRADHVRDPMAVPLDLGVGGDPAVELRERVLRAVLVGEVPERLLEAREPALAARELRLVGRELRCCRRLRGIRRAPRRAGDEARDLGDVVLAQLVRERRHAAPSLTHLLGDGGEARGDGVEVGADASAGPCSRQRMAIGATGLVEEAGALTCRSEEALEPPHPIARSTSVRASTWRRTVVRRPVATARGYRQSAGAHCRWAQ